MDININETLSYPDYPSIKTMPNIDEATQYIALNLYLIL